MLLGLLDLDLDLEVTVLVRLLKVEVDGVSIPPAFARSPAVSGSSEVSIPEIGLGDDTGETGVIVDIEVSSSDSSSSSAELDP